jgi:coproporphyrinogen III oxidase
LVDKYKIGIALKTLQDNICQGLEALDGVAFFKEDLWERPGGGGGRTRVIEGDHIEKGGVNFSSVYGPSNAQMNKVLGIDTDAFFATGVSIVLHPSNPWVPIIHMNIRYFEAGDLWWFGGGIDVTPHYINQAEASAFHHHLKSVCDQFNEAYYEEFKAIADDYFFIKHRNETRGVGGIFFDRLTTPRIKKEEGLRFILAVGNAFLPIYTKLFSPNFGRTYTDEQKNWQLLRRGRYVEFNLVWDKGTKFGLETDGRTESILMSLPKDARWMYDFTVTTGSPEEETLSMLKKGINWLNVNNLSD